MTLFDAAAVLWCGYVVCEFNHVIIPYVSTYRNQNDAAENAPIVVWETFSLEPTNTVIAPISQQESISEKVDVLARDMAGGAEWTVFDPLTVQPFRGRIRTDAEIAAERDQFDSSLNDAGFLIGVLTDRGYAAAYSRGANVWVNAPEDDPVMPTLGMRWSSNRKQWWRRTATEGAAQRTSLTHYDDIARRSSYPYVSNAYPAA